jgi:hypothetical protein
MKIWHYSCRYMIEIFISVCQGTNDEKKGECRNDPHSSIFYHFFDFMCQP